MATIRLKPKNRERLLEAARAEYAEGSDDNVEIDDNAEIHRSTDKGFWVAAWVYLNGEDLK
ncbi:MAG TPA: hypothetical protein VIJ38_16170 [Acidobacteriaceae bacterium]